MVCVAFRCGIRQSLQRLNSSHFLLHPSQADAKIMGGLIVEVGDNYIDMSTKSKINKIVSLMNEN